MEKRTKTNPLKNISILKLAGINKFILLDVYPGYLKILYLHLNKPFYKLTINSPVTDCEIIAYEKENYNGSLEGIEHILKTFILKHSVEGAHLIIGINEYRAKTIVVNKEVEDVNLWFLENTDKFIPAGRPIEEFSYSYEKYKEDDDNYYYLIAVSRKDYIVKLTKACANTGIKILSITPFSLALHSLEQVKNVKAVLVDISLTALKYSYTDSNGNLFTGEFYHQIFNSEPTESAGGSIDQNKLIELLKQLGEAIKFASNGNGTGELNLFLSVDPVYYKEIEEVIKKFLLPVSLNKNYEDVKPNLLTFFFVLDNTTNKFDDKINLLDNEVIDKERFKVEKQIVFRATLASGAIIMSLLFLMFILESFVAGKIKAGQDNLLEVTAKTSVAEKLEVENLKLRSNLKVLEQLKGNRVTYSNLLTSLSKVVTKKSCFTDINLKEVKENIMAVTFSG